MLTIGILIALAFALGWRPLRSAIPSDSVRAFAMTSVALVALVATGMVGG